MGKKQAGTGPLSRRPDNSAFKQQRLPAWSPSLTAQTVLPTFYILSLVCLFLGIWLLITVQNTYELKVRCFFYFFFIKCQFAKQQEVEKQTRKMCYFVETTSTQPTNPSECEFSVFLLCNFMY